MLNRLRELAVACADEISRRSTPGGSSRSTLLTCHRIKTGSVPRNNITGGFRSQGCARTPSNVCRLTFLAIRRPTENHPGLTIGDRRGPARLPALAMTQNELIYPVPFPGPRLPSLVWRLPFHVPPHWSHSSARMVWALCSEIWYSSLIRLFSGIFCSTRLALSGV